MFIRTHRLFLRPAWQEDAGELARAFTQESVIRVKGDAPWPLDDGDPGAFLFTPRPARWPALLVTLPTAHGLIAGACALNQGGEASVELGCWIAPAARRQGFAKEVLGELIGTARMLGHQRLTARHAPNNQGAARLLRACGLHPVPGSLGEATVWWELPLTAIRASQPDWTWTGAYAEGIGAPA